MGFHPSLKAMEDKKENNSKFRFPQILISLAMIIVPSEKTENLLTLYVLRLLISNLISKTKQVYLQNLTESNEVYV